MFLADNDLWPSSLSASAPTCEVAIEAIRDLLLKNQQAKVALAVKGESQRAESKPAPKVAAPPLKAQSSKLTAQSSAFDPAWQNPDGTLKEISRKEAAALTPAQKKARDPLKKKLLNAAYRDKYKTEKSAAKASKSPSSKANKTIIARPGGPLNPPVANGAANGPDDAIHREALAMRDKAQDLPCPAGRLA
jgi:hypothetical protein